MQQDYTTLMLSLWQSACQDTPKRPSARVENGHFVLTINGNRDNWAAITQAAGVPAVNETTIDGDTMTVRWPSVADQIFGADGLIAQLLPNYEVRLPQLYMARLVQRAIEMGQPAVVEAGTGIGKSFGYAAVCMALGKKVIISTSNKALQMQLIEKDLPFLQRIYPGKRVAVSVGKNNYACMVKADHLGESGGNIEDGNLYDWYNHTDTGNTEEISFAVNWEALEAITVDDDCVGVHCGLYDKCFYYRARRRLQDADVIVTNHALLCLNEIANGGILPAVDVVVVDEAHKLPDYMRKAYGHEFTLVQARKSMDLTAGFADPEFEPGTAFEAMRRTVAVYLAGKDDAQIGVDGGTSFDAAVSMAQTLRSMANDLWSNEEEPDDAEETKRSRRADRVRKMADAMESVGIPIDGFVRWIDQGEKDKRRPTPVFCIQPIDVSDCISRMAARQPTVFCSATLAAPDMAHFMTQAGLPQALQMQAASPFDYANNALLYLPSGTAPAPSAQGWLAWAIDEMRQLVLASRGGAFLLFTSYKAMDYAVKELGRTFTARGLTVLVQGEMPKLELARRFRSDGNAVLFATKSFFEGVSIDGAALRLVVVDKMPFEAPTPLTQAMEADMLDKARAAGISGKALEMYPFNHLRVPRMIIELKQALGRLIRTSTDTGVMAVLDSRVRASMYGRSAVIPSLPPAALCSRMALVQAFYGTLPPVSAALTAPPAEVREEKRVEKAAKVQRTMAKHPATIDESIPF